MVLSHIHAYIKWKERRGWYKCGDPGCTSFTPADAIKDKEVTCTFCMQNTVILDNYQRRLARPRCLACSNTKEAKQKRVIRDTLSSIFGEIKSEKEEPIGELK